MLANPDPVLQSLTQNLDAHADQRDRQPAWPQAEWDAIAQAGLLKAILPPPIGSDPKLSQILGNYRTVARGSLALALILTQRDGATDLIARGPNQQLHELLPDYAAARRHTSVGISQVTTSKGTGAQPKLRATPIGGGFQLDGLMPWVTGAHHCNEIVTAAVLEDGQQILGAVPTNLPGLRIGDPMQLLALVATDTCVVHCDNVRVSNEWIIKPPSEAALTGRAPVKGMTVTSVGIGLSDRIVLELNKLCEKTPPEVWAPVGELLRQQSLLVVDFEQALASLDRGEPLESTPIRVRTNDLLVRLATALVNIGKGSGYVAGKRPERLLREAMFFQVWSIPDAVRAETLGRLV